MEHERNSIVRSIFYFDSMLIPKLITAAYWLGLVCILFGAIGMMAESGVVEGIAVLLIGPIILRFWCELMIVVFKINENIQKIADRS